MAHKDRQYEAIVWGSSGYTGLYTCQAIVSSLPTDFRWAIAGRSESKLKQLAEDLRSLNPDRLQPSVEIAQLVKEDLEKLARKTAVFISTVGPYHKYGTLAVEVCAETGTHYLDVTGETPWVYDMIQKYDETAKQNKAIIINQIGVESAPADLLAWSLVSFIRKQLNTGTAEVVQSTHILESAPSGGTLATVLSIFETYSIAHFAKSSSRWSMSAVKPPKQSYSKGIVELLTGYRAVRGLPGPLTDSIQASADIPLVHRSWSLFDGGKFYGPKFYLSAYMRVSSMLSAIAVHYGLTFGVLFLLLPPVRWLLRRFVYQPGQGPTREKASKDRVEWRAVATADTPDMQNPKQAYMSLKFDGSMYQLTGIFLAEAAITLSRDQTMAHKIGGGLLTPATLGEPFFSRLQKVGLQSEIHMLS